MSTIVLHGTWSPGDGYFCLWGEDAYRLTQKRRRAAQRTTPRHPYLLQHEELTALAPAGTECAITMLLPTVADLGPLPSPELLIDLPAHGSAGDPGAPAPWAVTGVALSPADALAWLVAPPALAEPYTLGSDLQLWSQIARFALDLLYRERFVPTVRPKHAEAFWRLLLTDAVDEERLTKLAASLPPVSLSLLPRWQAARPIPLDPQGFIVHFLEATTDATIREWLRPDAVKRRPGNRSNVTEWADALASESAEIDPETRANLLPFINHWLEPLIYSDDNPAPTPLRACLRLEPPDASPESEWTLRVLLQAVDEPDLLVPATEVWRARGNPFRYGDRRLHHPPERLLTALRHAAELFAPIAEQMTHTARPVSFPLTDAEAFRFLTAAAQPLSDEGFGILLPASLQQKHKMTARARLQAPTGGLRSNLGLAQMLEVSWDLALGSDRLSLSDLRQLAEQKAHLVQWRGKWVQVDPDHLKKLARQLEKREGHLSVGETLRLITEQHLETLAVPIEAVEMDTAVEALIERLNGADRLTLIPPPISLCGQLRPYQERGFSWLAFLRNYGIGACLADDMGLGKSIQVIALLLHEREAKLTDLPTLLICPTSLVGNWQREFSRFAPSLKVMIHHGAGRLRHEAFVTAAQAHDVVISTYALSHRDLADLSAVPWAGLVLDEAQNIKNAATRQSQSLRSLPSRYRIALTGTPVENRLAELWSLMDFLNPGYLGSAAEFQTRFATRIERHGDEEAAAQLRQLVQPFLLRRVKTDPAIISDLPEKLEQSVYVNLTKEQATLYAAIVDDMLKQIERAEGLQRRGLVLATLTRLKQICNHPAQFLGDASRLGGRSGKLERLVSMLDEVLAEGDRALVFTQYAGMGHILQAYLSAVHRCETLFLHGGVPSEERQRMVQRFTADDGPPIFILTIKAGGVGLNLTQATHVFHFDRWWNPAVEAQATDRAYRIGQTRNVMVHKLISAGTVEEKIDALMEGKRQLADRIISPGESWLTELSTQELRTLFALERE